MTYLGHIDPVWEVGKRWLIVIDINDKEDSPLLDLKQDNKKFQLIWMKIIRDPKNSNIHTAPQLTNEVRKKPHISVKKTLLSFHN